MRPKPKSINVVPRSAGGKYPDGSPVLPTVFFEGSSRRVIPAHGACVIESAYYLRRLHSRDLKIVDELPPEQPPRPPKALVKTEPTFTALDRKKG